MGLPGSGKTFLSKLLYKRLVCIGYLVSWFNADDIRKRFDDWDFSEEGRIRQSYRMAEFANSSGSDYSICDFVAPLEKMRDIFDANYIIWMDTIEKGRFEDTNRVFVPPKYYDLRITNKKSEEMVDCIASFIIEKKNSTFNNH